MNKYPYVYEESPKNAVTNPSIIKDYVWQDSGISLEQEINRLGELPIVEIGGPTVFGFYFLNNTELPTSPIISNITDGPMPFHPEAEKIAKDVKEIIDGRHMDFKDDSIGVMLMSNMSRTDDWFTALSDEEKENPEIIDKANKELVLAQQEEELAALGLLSFSSIKYAQRIQIYREIQRVLAKGGLFLGNGTVIDLSILQKMGFELVAFKQSYTALVEELGDHQGQTGYDYEFVFRKAI